MSKTDEALAYMWSLIQNGMDYADAHQRAVTKFKLSGFESDKLQTKYDRKY